MSTAAQNTTELQALMDGLGQAAQGCREQLAQADAASREKALIAAAAQIRERAAEILSANALDMQQAREHGLSAAMLDRLLLDAKRIESMACGLEAIAALPDVLGTVSAEWTRPNGLRIQRVRVPLGVIGMLIRHMMVVGIM